MAEPRQSQSARSEAPGHDDSATRCPTSRLKLHLSGLLTLEVPEVGAWSLPSSHLLHSPHHSPPGGWIDPHRNGFSMPCSGKLKTPARIQDTWIVPGGQCRRSGVKKGVFCFVAVFVVIVPARPGRVTWRRRRQVEVSRSLPERQERAERWRGNGQRVGQWDGGIRCGLTSIGSDTTSHQYSQPNQSITSHSTHHHHPNPHPHPHPHHVSRR